VTACLRATMNPPDLLSRSIGHAHGSGEPCSAGMRPGKAAPLLVSRGAPGVQVRGLTLKWVAPLVRRGFVSEACEVDGAGGVEGFLGCAYW
jgi:hypothetical protein